MKIDNFKQNAYSFKGFFPTLREQAQNTTYENPYATRDDLIKPLPAEGHLVETNIFNAPKHYIKGVAYNFNSLKKGINGTANDHELGKLNNIGMVTGGTALATYLATRKQVASSKAMEFIGVGSFLASMALWPVVAIQIPTKLIHGFNVRKNYVDSMNREKPVFNDPQYIPWDLYSNEQINKVGDRMGVPQDMNNRRAYIQNKMKKIATQDNTLWTLSAGFAVPIMSALICNRLEQPVKDLCARIRSNQNKNILQEALNKQVTGEDSEMGKRLNSLLELHNGKPLTQDLIGQICDVVSYDGNPMVNQTLHKELDKVLSSEGRISLNPTDTNRIQKGLKKNLSHVVKDDEIMNKIVPNAEELTQILSENGMLDRELTKAELLKFDTSVVKKVLEKVNAHNETVDKKIPTDEIVTALRNKTSKTTAVRRFETIRPAKVLDVKTQKTLKSLVKELSIVQERGDIVKDYIFKELSSAPETKLANTWNKSMNEVFSALDIPWNKMDKARSSRELMTEVVRSSFDKIASNKTEYTNVVTKLAEVAKHLDEFDEVVSEEGNKTFFEQTIGKVLDPSAKKLEELGFVDTAQAFAGTSSNSEKSVLKAYAGNRLLGVKSTIYRLIGALDMHRRIATLTNDVLSDSTTPREIKEEIVELSKHNSLVAHRSDFAVKFFFNGNPHPDRTDTSPLEINDGRVSNKYYKAGREGYTDVSGDSSLYRSVMNLMYDGEMHPETKQILGDKLDGKISSYRKDCLNFFGDEYYFIRPESFVTDLENGKANYAKPTHCKKPNKFKFLLTGVSMDDLAMNFASQKHNSRAWMKLFGGLGLAIFTATVSAQFLFGKTPLPANKEQVQA